MQLALFLIVFMLIYALHNRITLLQKELTQLKRNYIAPPVEPVIEQKTDDNVIKKPSIGSNTHHKTPIQNVQPIHTQTMEQKKTFQPKITPIKKEPSKLLLSIQTILLQVI